MHYEERWIDGWLWYRRAPHGPWQKAAEEQMISRMRKALELVVEITDYPEHKKNDSSWLRGAILAARGAALSALGPPRLGAEPAPARKRSAQDAPTVWIVQEA